MDLHYNLAKTAAFAIPICELADWTNSDPDPNLNYSQAVL